MIKFLLPLSILLLATSARAEIYHAQGEMAGEVSETSALLHSRLTASQTLVDGDVPGATGFGRFEYATTENFENSKETTLLNAHADYCQEFAFSPPLLFRYRTGVGGGQRIHR